MNTYSMYELECPVCKTQYTQMLSQREEDLPIPCPSCEAELEKIRKLSGAELLSCVSSYGGS